MMQVIGVNSTSNNKYYYECESIEDAQPWLNKHLGKTFDTYEVIEENDDFKVRELEVIYKYALERMELGKKCLGLFIGLIHKRMYPDEQREELLRNATVLKCIQHFQFGKLTEVKELIQTIEADDYLFFQEDLDDVIFYIDQKTGV
jgi:hypothetical protein